MSDQMPLSRPMDAGEQRFRPVLTVGPYVLLAPLVIFTVIAKHADGTSLLIELSLCALAAVWMLWMFTLHPAWRVRPRMMAVFFTVLVVIMAALVLRDPWFGFLAPAGYMYAFGDLFYLDEQGSPTVVSGVPPDYFSATGQLWGNPIYRWHVLAATGYKWWIERFRASLSLFDMVRLDH